MDRKSWIGVGKTPGTKKEGPLAYTDHRSKRLGARGIGKGTM